MRPSGLGLLFVLLAISSSACSRVDVASTVVTRHDVVAALVDSGLELDMAECSVGLAEREFELAELMPDAAGDANQQALIAEVVRSCRDAAAILDSEPQAPTQLAFDAGPYEFGDDDRLDKLWTRCEGGDGAACDLLWEEAPVDSAYEEFGVTCGGRPDLLDCSEELIPGAAEGE